MMHGMEPTRILAIRHGETAWNVDTRIQGHLDIPLNATGREQASRLARALLGHAPIGAICSSDLSRALQTARVVADELNALVPKTNVVLDKTARDNIATVFTRIAADLEAAK